MASKWPTPRTIDAYAAAARITRGAPRGHAVWAHLGQAPYRRDLPPLSTDWPAIQAEEERRQVAGSRSSSSRGSSSTMAAELGWSSARLVSSAVKAPDRVEFEGRLRDCDVPIAQGGLRLLEKGGQGHTRPGRRPWRRVQNPEVARYVPAIIGPGGLTRVSSLVCIYCLRGARWRCEPARRVDASRA